MMKTKYTKSNNVEVNSHDTIEYILELRHQINKLNLHLKSDNPKNIDISAAKSVFDVCSDIDIKKMDAGFKELGLEPLGNELKYIQDLKTKVPNNAKLFASFLEKHGFAIRSLKEGKGTHQKYRFKDNPNQYITYSPHMKSNTCKACIKSMQSFMMISYVRKLKNTMGEVPKRYLRAMRVKDKLNRKKLKNSFKI